MLGAPRPLILFRKTISIELGDHNAIADADKTSVALVGRESFPNRPEVPGNSRMQTRGDWKTL